MKNSVLILSVVLFSVLLSVSGCKKEKTPEVYFTSSSATGTVGGSTYVLTMEFSETTTSNVELDFQSVGRSFASFGSYNQRFALDDSEKCNVTIDNAAFIDSAGHIKIGYGVKKVTFTFTAQYDNFPHTAAEYIVKISNAKNAVIRQGSDVFTYSIGAKTEDNMFQSSIYYTGYEHESWRYADTLIYFDTTLHQNVLIEFNVHYIDTMLKKSATYNLGSFTFNKINSVPQYDLVLNYLPDQGSSSKATNLTIEYPLWNKPVIGSNTSTCADNSVTVSWNPPLAFGQVTSTMVSLTCSDLTTSNTSFNFVKSVSPVYGDYNTFTGNVDLKRDTSYAFFGTLNSTFLLFH